MSALNFKLDVLPAYCGVEVRFRSGELRAVDVRAYREDGDRHYLGSWKGPYEASASGSVTLRWAELTEEATADDEDGDAGS